MTVNKLILLPAVAALLVATSHAQAGEHRAGNTAMGATAGLLVGGPVGAVAGGVIGYTSGEHIARGMGLKRHHRYRRTADGRRVRVY
jgi:outer membrane lipoprotein SlyB